MHAQTVPEQDVKAAFLYNFTRFITWPDGSPPGSEPFRICVVADGSTTRAVERAMAGETINGRRAEAVVPRFSEEARRCQILYLGPGAGDRAQAMLAAVRDLPVLTVGDDDRFTSRGGTIQFVIENDRVRFDVNLANAERARLTVSSRLLRVARKIDGGRGPRP